MDDAKSKCYFVLASYTRARQLYNVVSDPGNAAYNSPFKGVYDLGVDRQYWAKVVAVHKDSSGKLTLASRIWDENDTADGMLSGVVNNVVSKANDQIQDETNISAEISKFGSPLDYVLAYSATGAEYKLKSESHTEKYVAPEVDMTTTSDFKTGVWYYNAKELKQYADANQIPVFAEFSDYGCTPCTKFRTEIYERQEFQEWVAMQPYLFCRIETKSFGEFDRMFTQPYFICHEWAKGGSIGLPGFIFYWNRDQNPVWDLFGYHDNQIGYLELIDMITQKFKQ